MKKSFRQFVSEENNLSGDDIDRKFNRFVADCSDYFKNCPEHFTDVLWRGDTRNLAVDSFIPMSRNIPAPVFHTYDRTTIQKSGRTSKDTPTGVHNIANEIFIKKFGYPFRDGVMAVAQHFEASSYNPVDQRAQVFVPANGFTLCYSPRVMDFFGDLVEYKKLDKQYNVLDEDEFRELLNDEIGKAKYVEGVQHLSDAITSNHEVMFYPKDGQTLRYYLFSEGFWDDELIPRLKKTFHK